MQIMAAATNSTFTNVVIASTGTDIYSTVSGSIGSMKGPRHGGANIKVAEMMDAVLEETGGYAADDKKIKAAVNKLMDGVMTVPVLCMDLAMQFIPFPILVQKC